MSAVSIFSNLTGTEKCHPAEAALLHLDCLSKLQHGRAELHRPLGSTGTFLEAEEHPHFKVTNVGLALPTDVKGSICFKEVDIFHKVLVGSFSASKLFVILSQ